MVSGFHLQLSIQSTSDVRSPSVVLATNPAAAGPPAPSARAGPVDVGAPPTALRKAFPMPAARFTQDGIPELPGTLTNGKNNQRTET